MNIPDYEIILNHRQQSKGGGTAILICKNIPYKIRKDLVDFDEKNVEMTYLEITTKSGKLIVLGSLYRLSNIKKTILAEHIKRTTDIIKGEKGKKQMTLGMDHNLDLLI